MLKGKLKKRFLIYLIIPVLVTITFLTDELVYRAIASGLLLIYVAFIIFLRDSVKDSSAPEIVPPEIEPEKRNKNDQNNFETDFGEELKIISAPEKIEVLTSDSIRPKINGGSNKPFKSAELKENYQKIAFEKLPNNVSHDEQFAFSLEKILTVAKEAFVAHSALFFWYNKGKQKLTLEKYVSSSEAITEHKFDVEDDVLSKIVQNEEPELLTGINSNAEVDSIRYYDSPQGIRSFVGVPLFYGDKLAGILALDSKESDLFGIETVYSLGRIVRVISIFISLFEEKFRENQSEQRLNTLLHVLNADKRFDTEIELFKSLESAVKNLIPWDAFTFVYYNPNERKFKTLKIVNNTTLKYIGENLEVDLNNTLVGKAVMSGIPVKIDDTSISEIPRFTKNENVSFDGSFLAVPLVYDNENYGVLCFESLKKNNYNLEDVKFLKSSTKIFAFILFAYSNNKMLTSLLSHDIETRLLNKNAFLERFGTDLIKAAEFNIPGVIALIKIDDFLEQDSLFEGNPFPKVLATISSMIKEEMTPLNLLSRIDKDIFGIYFFNSTTKDVFLWAEKLRMKIARKPIAVVAKQTTFTVSIGIASTTNFTDMNELINNAELALNKAIEKGGNNVKSMN